MPELCVYTTLLGGYEQLNEQPAASSSRIPFICMTDDPDLRSASWEMRVVQPAFGSDPIRSQREIKLRPHVHFPEFTRSLYIDNSVILKQPPERLFERAEKSPEGFLLPSHSFRQTVLDEFLEVARLGLDDSSRVIEQLNHYLLSSPEVLEQKPWWTAIMVRDHSSARLRAVMEIWTLHVMRYSRRDQLSVNMALSLAGVSLEPLQIDNFESQFHVWPQIRGRDRQRSERSPASDAVPLSARLPAAEREAEHSHREAAGLLEQIRRQKRRIADLSADCDALLGSTSWRLTRPLRLAMGRMPNLHALLRRTIRPGSRKNNADIRQGAANSVLPDRVLGQLGKWIYVDPADHRGQCLIEAAGSLNPPTLLIWEMLLAERDWSHILDVGANYGEMLVNVKLPRNAEVIAVEPNPVIRAKLARTLQEAGIAADIPDVAFSDIEGEGRLLVDETWSGTTRLARRDESGGVPVRTETLGAAFRRLPVPLTEVSALIKIDVEGNEVGVLRGGLDELSKLGRFAALVELLHASPQDLAWLAQHFDIEMLRLGGVPKLVPVSRGKLSDMLASDAFYRQDVVLRRREG